MKKTRTSAATSRPTKVEVRLDKEPSESSSTSGWWGSVSKTWKRIKSSVSLTSMAQEDEQDLTSNHEEEEHVKVAPPEERQERQERQDRPVAPKPRRALPGGLASLPIDTPMHPSTFRAMATGSFDPSPRKTFPNANTNVNAIASSSRSDMAPPSEMRQVGGRRVTISNSDSGSQRSAAIKALFSSGAPSPHFSAIPSYFTKNAAARPSPLSQSQSVERMEDGQTQRQSITIPRVDVETGNASPAVRDLVRSFEEAANRSTMSATTEADVSSELGSQSGVRRVNSSDDFRRRSAMFEDLFDDAQEKGKGMGIVSR
jgi:hypothetical protein